MGYPKEVHDRAFDELRARAQDARNRTLARHTEIAAALPEIPRLERELAGIAAGISRVVVAEPGSAAARIDELKARSLELQERRRQLLRGAGYDDDYLEEQYHCSRCKDTGYIGAKTCTCLQELLKKAAYERLGNVSGAGRCDFAGFRLDYYPNQPDDTGMIPRERMGQILSYCRQYAADFSVGTGAAGGSESLLMLGQTGLGKTHLSLAIAAAVTDAGFGVIYTPVQKLLDRLESDKFSYTAGAKEQYSERIEQILTCDLLILDDLGTEFYTQFTGAVLYNIVNTRLVEGRATVISTNLTVPKIEERYSGRMLSRLICSYKVLGFCGKDIRFLKKAERK